MADRLSSTDLFETLLNRRDLLKRATVLGVGSAGFSTLLAACGGDDDDDEPTEPAESPAEPTATEAAPSGDATEPAEEETEAEAEETEAEAGETEEDAEGEETEAAPASTPGGDSAGGQRGGTFSSYETVGPESLDPYISGGQPQSLWSAHSYSQLFMLETGPGVPQGSQETVPDAAASYEVSEDALVYTITLKDNVYWHPPLDRTMVAQDVTFTWERGTTLESAVAGTRLVGRGLGEVVESVEATDDLTVVFTLNGPYPFFTQLLADPKQFFIMPQETDTEFNPADTVVGSGPWVLEEFRPDTAARFRRFDKWHHGPEIPYYDEVVVNIIPEYATQLTQFLGGNLDWIILQTQDLQRVKDQIPDVQIYQRGAYPLSVLNFSPRDEFWEDVRLRRAISMAIDRDALLDAAYGLRELEAQGIEVVRNWHNNIPVAFSEYWLDPKGDRISEEAAANFRYDPDAARALVEEAGGPFDTELHYAAAGSRYGEPYRIMSELMIQYWREVGINVRAVEEDYNTEFLGSDGTSGGNFNGLMWIAQTRLEPFQYLQSQITDNENEAMYARWASQPWHADLMERLEEIRALTDTAELAEAILDMQDEMNKLMFVVPMQWSAFGTYVAYQPWVENALDYQSFTQNAATEAVPYYWSSR